MKNTSPTIVHVEVRKDEKKIEKLCRIAMIQKKFEILGWEKADNEKELQKELKEHLFHNLTYFLVFDSQKKEINYRRLRKPEDEMEENEEELTFRGAIEWLKSI
jgi:hypothetical protein